MIFDLFASRKSAEHSRTAGVVAILSRDEALIESFSKACERLDVSCLPASNIGKLARSARNGCLVAVVWDTRVMALDTDQLPRLNGCDTIISLGPPSPSGPHPRAILCLPCDWPVDTIVRGIEGAVEGTLAKRKLGALEKRLEGDQNAIEEDRRVTKALREHIELYDMQRNQLSEVLKRTAYLGQLSKEINCLDVQRIIDICVTKASKLVDATVASVYSVNEEGSELTLRQSNHSRRITDRIAVESDPPHLMTLAVRKRAVLLVKDVDAFARTLNRPLDRTYADKYRTRSCIVVPLISDDRVMAVLNLADKASGAPFDEVRDLPLVDHFSQFTGIALRNCQLYNQVCQLARTDALTGFINHKAFFEELKREVDRVRRNRSNLSLVLIDVDNFKLFNDVHGHQVGDMVLKQVAQLVRNSVRTVDIAARYGGDEFAVILADADMQHAETVAERIRRAIASNQITLNGQAFFVTISAGIAQYDGTQALADIVSDADAALYRAKSRGRNTISISGAS